MPHQNIHLSDQELIMAADGELPVRRKAQITAHLDACWSCRERMGALESTIAEFVRGRNQELHDRIPSIAGPRALLRARMAEAAPESSPRAIWRLGPAAAAFCSVLAAVLIIFEATVNAEGPKPKAGLTPGETRPVTVEEVCRSSEAAVGVPNIPDRTREQVFAAYGISAARRNEFEVDYLITPDLGGAESVRNLWPQPYSARWNAHVKDRLEQRLHQLVCEGKVDLSTAQRDIAVDWIGAYRKYVGR